jgi:anti-sigma B factor antagonist
MNIVITNEEGVYTIKLGGFVDTASSPYLQKKVEDISSETYEKGGFNVVFDLADVEFVSSAGLRVLLMARKMADRQNGNITLVNVKDSIRDVLNMTGFAKILNIK